MASYNQLVALLAEAACAHPNESWAKRAKALVPDLERHYTPPCPGQFAGRPDCDKYHIHTLDCGKPTDVCTLCHKTNAEHRRPA